jgi:nitroreductase
MAEFSELLKKRRSIRDFEDRQVPTNIVRDIIKDTCLAPSAANRQPWRFVIINDKDLIKQLSDESKNNLIADIEKSPGSPNKNYEAALRNPEFNVFYNAPCLVFIVGSKHVRSLYVDCALAASYFMFCASERGLGTCWVGLGTSIQDPELLGHLGMSEDHTIVAPIILGYPKSVPSAPERNEPQILKIVGNDFV